MLAKSVLKFKMKSVKVDTTWRFVGNRRQLPNVRSSSTLPTMSTFGLKAPAEGVSVSKVDPSKDGILMDKKRIRGCYTDDLNILSVHNIILNAMEEEKKKIPMLNDRIVEIERLAEDKSSLTIGKYRALISELNDVKGELKALLSSEKMARYLAKSRQLLEEYQGNRPSLKVVKFGKEEKRKRETMDDMIRHRTISRYLDLARDYIEIDVIRIIRARNECRHCNRTLDDVVPSPDGSFTCPGCLAQIEYTTKIPVLSDSINKAGHQQNNYKDKGNFEKALKRYQGKQLNNLPPDIEERLDEYFGRLGMTLGSTVKELPFTKCGRKKPGTSRTVMTEALKRTGMSGHYKDIDLVCHIYWGWKLPDISHIEEKIMSDYDEVKNAFEKVKGDERKSCLNTQYVLFRLLQRNGHPCNFSDFKIVTTGSIFRYYQVKWKEICTILGWRCIPFY